MHSRNFIETSLSMYVRSPENVFIFPVSKYPDELFCSTLKVWTTLFNTSYMKTLFHGMRHNRVSAKIIIFEYTNMYNIAYILRFFFFWSTANNWTAGAKKNRENPFDVSYRKLP